MTIFKEIAGEIEQKVLSKLTEHTPADISLEEYVSLLTTEAVKEEVLSGKFNTEIQRVLIDKFKFYVQGTEYNTSSVLEHFEFFVENEIKSARVDFRITSNSIRAFVRFPADIFGAIGTWEGAVLSARKLISKHPNKYPLKASYFWRYKVYPTSKLDETMALRLSFAYGQAPYVRLIEQGTNTRLAVSYGGFPTPSYSGRGSFIPIIDRAASDVINDFIKREFDSIRQSILSNLKRDFGDIPLTTKLRDILATAALSDVEAIVSEIRTADNTTKVLSVIINIEDRYYRIIRTRKGNWGLRFDISKYNRRK